MATSTPNPTSSQSRENRTTLQAQRIQTSAANKQVLHILPFAAVDDWALECFFDPIANENRLSTPEENRLRAIRMAGYAKVITETLDEVEEIASAFFASGCGGERGGQTEHTSAGTGAGREADGSMQDRADDTPVGSSMSSSSPGCATVPGHLEPEDDVWAEISGVKGMTGEQHWLAAMTRIGESEASHYGLQSGATAQDSRL